MRKSKKILAVTLAAAMVCSVLPASQANAAVKHKGVYSTLKNGVLTISGKGKMPKNMKFRGNTKIKKVIIKKGVTSIPDNAFKSCKKLKSVSIPNTVKSVGSYSFYNTAIENITIPKSVKTIGAGSLCNCKLLTTVTMPGKFKVYAPNPEKNEDIMSRYDNIKSVKLNTILDISNMKYFSAMNVYTWNKDTKYKSYDGVVYSKDGKTVLGMPLKRDELAVREGCTTFDVQAVAYDSVSKDSDTFACGSLRKVIIPESIEKVVDSRNLLSKTKRAEFKVEDIIVKSKKLDGNSIALLSTCFNHIETEKFMEKFSNQIKKEDGMYISNDNVLVKYDGKAKNVVIPSYVKEIADNAFYTANVESVDIPDSVTKFGKNIFELSSIVKVNLPKNMKTIPEGMFKNCRNLVDVKIPDSVEIVENEAFSGCSKIDVNIAFGANVKVIKSKAFSYVSWEKITVPESIVRIDEDAFEGPYGESMKKSVVIESSSKKITPEAFYVSGDDLDFIGKTSLEYSKNFKYAATKAVARNIKYYGNKKTKSEYSWAKVKDADGYQIYASNNKKFKKKIVVNVSKKHTSTKIIFNKKLSKIYVKIRPYKKIKGKKTYGRWVKTVGNRIY
ncbi:MAG: leucine-rich repeat domain-containing protein [Eubacterium ventriosum]|uniref:leucine-rich repeat domain-containing protein n=1 Tax=Eubacterium ventriosum TaxID=39496 RepID=UPI001DEDFA7A|nr:leucine-rich repeat domain-containing protein [Eubacterium ventriosum]MBD9055415.1 leucine-rich repeat domain-containing protein [Eubacterium ventriosum]